MSFLLNPFIMGSGATVYLMSAGSGSLARAGGAATMKRQLRMSASSGALARAGGPVTLTYVASYSLTAGSGARALAGGAATFKRQLRMVAASGSKAKTGGAATLTYGTNAHRYWRINVSAVDGGGYTELTELAWIATYYGTAYGTSAGAAASSSFGGSTPDKLYDGSTATFWTSGTNTSPQWTSMDFGAGNEKDIKGVILTGPNSTTSRAPKDFTVQYSDDNSTWTTAWSVTGSTSWAANEERTFYKTGYTAPSYSGSPWDAAVYWRVYDTSEGFFPAIAELEFRASPGGSNQSSGGTAVASTEFNGSFVAGNAFDGNASTAWSSSATSGQWLRYQHASAVKCGQIAVKARSDSPGTTPTNLKVQFSASSSGPWRTAFSYSGQTSWTAGEVRTFSDPLYI